MQTNHQRKLLFSVEKLCCIQWAWLRMGTTFWGLVCIISRESKGSWWRESMLFGNSTKSWVLIWCLLKFTVLWKSLKTFQAFSEKSWVHQTEWSHKLALFSDRCLVLKCRSVEYFVLLILNKFSGFELISLKMWPSFLSFFSFWSDFKVSFLILS